MLRNVPAGAGQQHIVHVPQSIVDPLNFRGLCLKKCIPAGRKTVRVLWIVSFSDRCPDGIGEAQRPVIAAKSVKRRS